MNAPRRAVLFDLDGTLVDSAPDIAVAVDHALTTHGHAAIGESRVRDYIGHGAARLIHRAHDAGARVILNLAPAAELPLEALKKCWLIVVNEQEAEFLAAQVGAGADAASLSARLGAGVLRTLGAEGSEACVEGVAHRVAAHAVKAVDTTAAGDCFVGVLAAALDRGLDLPAAMRRASVAAALACTKRGSQGSAPEAGEIDAAMTGG